MNGLTTAISTGTISVRGSDALLISDISGKLISIHYMPVLTLVISVDTDIPSQTYNFTFNINEKLDILNITLLINGSPIVVPYVCRRELNF